MTARFIVADVFDGLAQLEDGSIDLVITSPPFLALRSYLPADHPDKGKEIGSEATPAEFIDVMLRVTQELRRVLAPHGSIAVELGDTYAGGGQGPDANHVGSERPVAASHGDGWPLAKSVCMIPEAYRFALAYGFNPFTGQPSPAGKWRVRNKVTWCRPNPPVGALGDKWRPATSDVVVACVSPKRYWDDLATRRPLAPKTLTVANGLQPSAKNSGSPTASHRMDRLNDEGRGAPLLDYWEIPPGGYQGAHYAVFPPALVEPLVKAMGPQKVCLTCGEPARRITKQENHTDDRQALADHMREQRESLGITRAEFVPHFPHYKNGESVMAQVSNWELAKNVPSATDWPILVDLLDLSDEFTHLIEGTRQWTELAVTDAYRVNLRRGEGSMYSAKDIEPKARHGARPMSTRTAEHVTLGWTDCGHDNYRPGIVLDPFAGSGTTLAVATGHGLDAIGIDIDERNADLTAERVGPFLMELI